MEHIGCLVHSDFTDYYDHELGSTSHSHPLSFSRFKNRPYPIETQLGHLKSAGFNLLTTGPLGELILQQKDAFSELMSISVFQELVDYVIYDETGAPHLCPHPIAITLDPNRMAMSYLPRNPSHNGSVLTYVQVGALPFWLRRESRTDWRAGKGDSTTQFLDLRQPIAAKHARALPHAVFSIDFLQIKDALFALNYNPAPDLRALGFEENLRAEDAAQAIVERLDNSCLPEPINEPPHHLG